VNTLFCFAGFGHSSIDNGGSNRHIHLNSPRHASELILERDKPLRTRAGFSVSGGRF
jgi:hypothetical protein